MLRGFKNRMLWGIFGPKVEEVTVGWRNQGNKELPNFLSSRNIIRRTIRRG
jgi:hypothetical protein